MDAVKEWCIKIAGVLILSALCEGILPSGNIKKYVRILLGLILTICVCSPFAKGFSGNFIIEESRQRAYTETKNMEERERETVLRLYKANVARKMNDDLKAVLESCEFEFSLEVESGNMQEFGKIRGVIVTVITNDEELQADSLIEKILSEKYGVTEKNIAVNYRGK